MQKDQFDYLFKLALVGNSGTGKTSFLNKFVRDEFNLECKTTVGVSYLSKNLPVEDKVIKAQIWDASGAEKTASVAKSYYKGAVGAFLIYDITNHATFADIEKWLKELNDFADPQIVKVLIGNKSDLKFLRTVKMEEAKKFAELNQIQFVETSSLEGVNIDLAVLMMVQEIYKIFKKLAQVKQKKDNDLYTVKSH